MDSFTFAAGSIWAVYTGFMPCVSCSLTPRKGGC